VLSSGFFIPVRIVAPLLTFLPTSRQRVSRLRKALRLFTRLKSTNLRTVTLILPTPTAYQRLLEAIPTEKLDPIHGSPFPPGRKNQNQGIIKSAHRKMIFG